MVHRRRLDGMEENIFSPYVPVASRYNGVKARAWEPSWWESRSSRRRGRPETGPCRAFFHGDRVYRGYSLPGVRRKFQETRHAVDRCLRAARRSGEKATRCSSLHLPPVASSSSRHTNASFSKKHVSLATVAAAATPKIRDTCVRVCVCVFDEHVRTYPPPTRRDGA